MAIYHFSAKIISRKNGSSSVGSSAYRSGEKLVDERTGITHDYRRKKGIVYSEILVPSNAPSWAKERQKLWNEVEKIEKSKNSQLAREINIAIPREFNKELQIEFIKKYTEDNFVKNGMVADIAIHDNKDGNPHAHIMLTMRAFDKEGEWLGKQRKEYILDKDGNKKYDKKTKTYKCKTVKTTNWDNKENIEIWRENLGTAINSSLERIGVKEMVDHRSLEKQGLERLPTKHEGYIVRAMEKRGIKTERGNLNREIVENNRKIELIEKQIDLRLELGGKKDEYRDRTIRERNRNIRDEKGIEKVEGNAIRHSWISRRIERNTEELRTKGKEKLERIRKDRELAAKREEEFRRAERERRKREQEEFRRFREKNKERERDDFGLRM